MNTIKHVLLKGKESFLDHTKSIALYGKLYWRKSNKKLNVGDIVYLFMSGKGHYQIRYKLEVTNTSVTRQDEECWLAPFVPDNDCFEFTPVAAMYEGEELGLKRYKSSIFPLKEKRNLILFSHLLANKVKCKLLSCKINIRFIQKRNKKLMSH